MRDILEDIAGSDPLDPTESARRNMRPQLRKRFYQRAHVGDAAPFAVLLDNRPVRTPAGNALALPSRTLGEAVAAEWDAQQERIDPAVMPLTRLVNAIIDGVATAPAPVADEVAKYLGSDLVCYRADTPAGLVARQAQHWDPILDWARETLGARFVLAEGVMFAAQPDHAIAEASAAIPSDPWRLGADRACAGARPPQRGRSLGRGACRRGLEHVAMGPRRGRARAPRDALRRDAGGGDRASTGLIRFPNR
jgi:chaperone required for assembly of F1-ATPase